MMWMHPLFNIPAFLEKHFIFAATKGWVGAALALAGGVMQGIASKQSADYKADLMDFNSRQQMIDAAIARQNAAAQASYIRSQGTAAALRGDEEASTIRETGRQITGTQRTRYAKSGVRMEGTPLMVMAQTIENIELDAIATRQAGIYAQKEAEWQAGLTERSAAFSASQTEMQAGFTASQADATRRAGTLGLLTSTLGGATSAASMFS